MGMFDTLYAATARATAAYIHARVHNWHDAEDITQDVYVKVWRSWDKITTLDHPGAWIRRIARNTIFDYYEVQGRCHEEDIEGLELPTHPIAIWEQQEEAREILAHISPRNRAVLLLNEAGFTFAEIARLKGLKPGKTYCLYMQARREANAVR